MVWTLLNTFLRMGPPCKWIPVDLVVFSRYVQLEQYQITTIHAWSRWLQRKGLGTCNAVSVPPLSQPQRLRWRKLLQCCARITSPACVIPVQPLKSSFSRSGQPSANARKQASVSCVPKVRSKVFSPCQFLAAASIAVSSKAQHRRNLQHWRFGNLGATDWTSLLTPWPHLIVVVALVISIKVTFDGIHIMW